MWCTLNRKPFSIKYDLQQKMYVRNLTCYFFLILFRIGIFGAAYGRGAKKNPLLKTCYIYSAMMKLGSYTLPKEDPKNL